MKYRKKPVVIEAVQFIGLDERFGNMRFRDSSPDWIEKAQLRLPTGQRIVIENGAIVTVLPAGCPHWRLGCPKGGDGQ